MARAKSKGNTRIDVEPGGLWHQPALMNLLADLLLVFSVAGLAWAALTALQRLPVFPLREVIVMEVPRQVSLQQIEHTSRGAVSGNFFTVNLESVRETFEKLPWVRKVSLQRVWPDGLALSIEEHEPKARWRHLNGEAAMVNRQGEVFDAEHVDAAHSLPLMTGPEGSAAEMLHRYGEFSHALAVIGRRVDVLSLSPRRAWGLKLDNGLAINLGRDQEKYSLTDRLTRLVAHYEGVGNRITNIKSIDMRYPNGFALVGDDRSARPVRAESAGRKS